MGLVAGLGGGFRVGPGLAGCRLAEAGAEVRVLDEFGEFNPGADLVLRGFLGQVGHCAAHHGQEVGAEVEAGEGVVDEIVD